MNGFTFVRIDLIKHAEQREFISLSGYIIIAVVINVIIIIIIILYNY